MKILRKILIFSVSIIILIMVIFFLYINIGNYTIKSNSPNLIIENGYFFNGTNELIKNKLIIVSNGRIECIGQDCSRPKNAKIIVLENQTVIPGLIDLHVHFNAISKENANYFFPKMIVDFMKYRPQIREKMHRYGITSIRSVGDTRNEILNLKEKISNKELEGPRTFITGPIFTAPNGHPAGTIFKGNSWLIENGTIQVSDVIIARSQVRNLAKQNVDGIKVVYDNGTLDNKIPRLSLDVMKVIIHEAKKHDLWVAVHTGSKQEVIDAIELGVTTIEHGITTNELIDSTILEELVNKNITYVPTLLVQKNQYASESEERFSTAKINTMSFYNSGIDIGAGTDTQGKEMEFGKSLIEELKLLSEIGMPINEVIKSATINASRALGQDKELGEIKENFLADILIIEGNPLDDFEALEKIEFVIQNGRIVYEKE